MKLNQSNSWHSRGFSLLWNSNELKKIIDPSGVISINHLFEFSKDWPDDLPGSNGDSLVVAGLDAVFETLSFEDTETWLKTSLKDLILEFSSYYEGDAALIFWLPNARKKINMSLSNEEYSWKGSGFSQPLPIGNLLFSGAQDDLQRVVDPEKKNPDPDSEDWFGLTISRIS